MHGCQLDPLFIQVLHAGAVTEHNWSKWRHLSFFLLFPHKHWHVYCYKDNYFTTSSTSYYVPSVFVNRNQTYMINLDQNCIFNGHKCGQINICTEKTSYSSILAMHFFSEVKTMTCQVIWHILLQQIHLDCEHFPYFNWQVKETFYLFFTN